MSALASNLRASTTRSEKEADIYKQLLSIFNDFSKILVAVIGMNSLFTTDQNVMICLVTMIVVYFPVLILGTVLQLYITNHLLLPTLIFIMLLLASAASVLALILTEPTIAFIAATLWVGVFISVAIFHRQELGEFMSSATGKVKSLIWRKNLQSPRPAV